MKRFWQGAVSFTKREWFLLVAIAAIATVIVLFQLL